MIPKIAWLFILIMLCLSAVLHIGAESTADHPFLVSAGIQVIAHRGGWSLWPENTRFGFQNAVNLDVDMLEMDIYSTRDEVLVVIHDDTVDRTTNGTGKIQDFTLSELKMLDAGYRWSPDRGKTFPHRGQSITIPTLAEIFEAFPNTPMSVEIKHKKPGIEAALCDLVRKYGMSDRILIASFFGRSQKTYRKHCPEAILSPGIWQGLGFYLLTRLHLSYLYQPDVQVLQVPLTLGPLNGVHPTFLSAARRHGYKIQVWTVNDEETMRTLIDLPIDGIITAYPDRLLSVLGR